MESQRELCPADESEVAAMLRSANEEGLAVIPRGGGSKQDWGNPPGRADLMLSTARLNRVIEHAWADLTVTVQAGCTIAALECCLAQHGQRLAIDVLWPDRATVGGILSTNDSGTLRLVYGGLRDLVIGITLVLADGTIARSGGKVVKNVAGYDLPKLATGALGTLGVITQASFRLHPLPQNTRTLSVAAGTTDRAQALLLEIQSSQLAHTSLQARFAASSEPWVDVRLEGTGEGMAAQEARLRQIAPFSEGSPGVWGARQAIADESSVAKFSVLPSQIASTLNQWARALRSSWRAVIQATGVGWLAAGPPLEGLRPELERAGGSLIILRGPRNDAWGAPGDTLPLLRAVKAQFDPKGTLNPGRFVGGI
jgi:glycolate oxidase FAD binding subunit